MQTRCIVKGEAQKSPLFWRFSGGVCFSQHRLFSRNSTRKPLNLIKSPIFTNAPCKTTCLYNAPSMHTVDKMQGFQQNSREIAQIVGGQYVGSMQVKDQTLRKTRTLLFPESRSWFLGRGCDETLFSERKKGLFSEKGWKPFRPGACPSHDCGFPWEVPKRPLHSQGLQLMRIIWQWRLTCSILCQADHIPFQHHIQTLCNLSGLHDALLTEAHNYCENEDHHYGLDNDHDKHDHNDEMMTTMNVTILW